MDRSDFQFFEKVIFRIIFQSQKHRDSILPYLTKDIFSSEPVRDLVVKLLAYIENVQEFPTLKDFRLLISEDEDLTNFFNEIVKMDLSGYTQKFLFQEIEYYFTDKLLFNKLVEFNELIKDGKREKIDGGKFDELKSFSFDKKCGLDLFSDDGETIYEIFQQTDDFIPTSMQNFNKFMGGGMPVKAMVMFIGGTNVGKTLIKCSMAADCLMQNKKVLYVTLEMIDKRIGIRIIQNILDMDYESIKKLSLEEVKKKTKAIKEKLQGKLIIEDYPASTFSCNNLKILLKNLKEKQQFIPEVIFIDYLGLMIPNSIGKETNTNNDFTKVAKELHGVAKSSNVSMITSMQFNRQGLKSSNPDITDVADSIGTMFTADEVVLILQPEELLESNKYELVKAKSRFTKKYIKTFLNVDYSKMKIWEDDEMTNNAVEDVKISNALSYLNNKTESSDEILRLE